MINIRYIWIKPLSVILCIFLLFGDALADAALPDDLLVIEEEAFRGDLSIVDMVIPGQVTTVCSRAFADTRLKTVVIPSSVTWIAPDAFENVLSPVLIITSPESAAVSFALKANIDFRADTVCRALIIGQCDYPDEYALDGPGRDIVTMQSVLTDFEVTVATNLTADGILQAIAETFAGAKEEDISLVYYCGHGREEDGALIGIDLTSFVTADGLRAVLDRVPGRKIVLADACSSGALIGRAASQTAENDFASAFTGAFAPRRLLLMGTLAVQPYYVMASSRSDEISWEAAYGGLFTHAFAESREQGDTDGDGVVTFEEAYQYAKQRVKTIAGASRKTQSVQVYPENCTWFGIYR